MSYEPDNELFIKTFEEAEEGSPFSNSTMGDMWIARNCDGCKNWDDDEQSCPILDVAYFGKTPRQWLRNELRWYICTERNVS